jgi:dipeptide transport system permease protein
MYVLRRLALLLPTFFGVTLLSFFLVRLIPGDPIEVMMGERQLDPALHAEALHRLGLDKPLYIQYWDYLKKLIHGDLGESFKMGDGVGSQFLEKFPATVELGLSALCFATFFGILAGVMAALKRGSWLDHTVMSISLAGFSMPIFWLGLMLQMFFSVYLGWTPVSEQLSTVYDIEPRTGFKLIDTFLSGEEGAFKDAWMHLILPTIVLGTIPLAIIARMTRSSMLEILREDYVRTAKAKGLSPFRIIFIHTLRNALIPVLTVVGLQVSSLLSGAILTETIFSWPGIGSWLVNAVQQRDYPVVQNGILLVAVLVILVNFVVEVLYGVVNPRIRHTR